MNEELNNLLNELEELKTMLEENKERLESFDLTKEYDEMLNECYPELFNMSPSYILKELDPIAYSCGLSDYEDEQRSELENDIESEEEQIKDIEEQIKELKGGC